MPALSVLLLWRHAEPRVGWSSSTRTSHTPWRQHGVESWPGVHGWTEARWHVELRRATRRESTTSSSSPTTATPTTTSKAGHSSKAQLVVRSSVGWGSKWRPPSGLAAARSSWPSHEVHASTHSASSSISTSSTGTWTGNKRSPTWSTCTTWSGRRPKVIVKRVGGDQMVHHGGRRWCKLSEVGEPRRLSRGFPRLLLLRALHL